MNILQKIHETKLLEFSIDDEWKYLNCRRFLIHIRMKLS